MSVEPGTRKLCKGPCGQSKALTEFGKRSQAKDGKQWWCRECSNAKARAYSQQSPVRARAREYTLRPYVRAKIAIRSQSLEYKAYHHERRQTLEWKLINRAHSRAQRVHKLKARPLWADEVVINEVYCGCAATITRTSIAHAVDHFWPLRHDDFSGLDVPWNLRVIPATENGAKSNKRPDVFYMPREFARITAQLNTTSLTRP